MDVFTWTTTFETASGTMKHFFSDQVSVVTNFKSRESKVYKDGKVIRSFKCDMPAPTYTVFLSSVAKDAEVLGTFKEKGE